MKKILLFILFFIATNIYGQSTKIGCNQLRKDSDFKCTAANELALDYNRICDSITAHGCSGGGTYAIDTNAWHKQGDAHTTINSFIGTVDSPFLYIRVANVEAGKIRNDSNSVSFGRKAIASDMFTTAVGDSSIASGIGATALGQVSVSTGIFSLALGISSTATSMFSTSIGSGSSVLSSSSTAIGGTSSVSGTASTAIGEHSIVMNNYSTAIGYNSLTNKDSSMVLGDTASCKYVGIGTTIPSSLFHVSGGSVTIQDGTQSNGYVFTSDANGLGSWQPSSGGGCDTINCSASHYYVDSSIAALPIYKDSCYLTCFGVDSAIAANRITLQTNTVTNGSQSLLNLVQGTNITLTDDGLGDVTIDAAGSSPGWLLSGNTGTDPTINFVGTIDFQSLIFRINNTFSGLLDVFQGNTSYGYGAFLPQLGSNNTAIGLNALASGIGFSDNTAVGSNALNLETTGNNTAIGSGAMQFYNDLTGFGQNTAVGYQTLNSGSGYGNVAIGYQTLFSNQGGIDNVGNGVAALFSNQTGSFNFGMGGTAMYYNQTGNQNIALGHSALAFQTSGDNNIALGFNSMYTTGNVNNCVAIGDSALAVDSVDNITAIGHKCLLRNQTGAHNVGIGDSVLISNVTGSFNTAIGGSALFKSIGSRNTAIGYNTLYNSNISADSNNIAIGSYAGYYGRWRNKLFIDPIDRTDSTTQLRKSLIVGDFGTDSSNQDIIINGYINPTNGIKGVTGSSNANAGFVGEPMTLAVPSSGAVTLSNGTGKTIDSLSLTAGDWDVSANANFLETTSTVTARSAGITTTSNTVPTDGTEGYCGVQSVVTTENNTITITTKRFPLSTTTKVYLVVSASFSAGTCKGFGSMTARRVR